MLKNKKAMGNIISVLFFILAAIVSIGIIFTSINSLITTNLSPALDCTQARIDPPISIQNACFNQQTKDVELTLKRAFTDDSEIYNLDLNLDGDFFSCGPSCGYNCEVLQQGQTKTYYLSYSDLPPSTAGVSVSGCVISTSEITACP